MAHLAQVYCLPDFIPTTSAVTFSASPRWLSTEVRLALVEPFLSLHADIGPVSICFAAVLQEAGLE